jgi:hypothetical protein
LCLWLYAVNFTIMTEKILITLICLVAVGHAAAAAAAAELHLSEHIGFINATFACKLKLIGNQTNAPAKAADGLSSAGGPLFAVQDTQLECSHHLSTRREAGDAPLLEVAVASTNQVAGLQQLGMRATGVSIRNGSNPGLGCGR